MDMLNKLKSSFTPLSQTVTSALQDTVYNTGIEYIQYYLDQKLTCLD